MPVLKHAKKKLRQDRKRTVDNLRIKKTYKKLIKEAKTTPNNETVSAAFSAIDKAAKKMVIHKNKAARLKASLTKSVSADGQKQVAVSAKKVAKSSKKPVKKKTVKKK